MMSLRLYIHFLTLFVIAALAEKVAGQAGPQQAAITNIVEVLKLSNDQAKSGIRVQVKGAITCVDPSEQLWFIQDATGGIYIYNLYQGEPLQLGSVVEVRGKTDVGLFSPIITTTSITQTGTTNDLNARAVSIDQIYSGQLDSQFVEIHGIVENARVDWHKAALTIAAGNSHLLARFQDSDLGVLTNLVDAEVKIKGVVGIRMDKKKRFQDFQLLSQNSSLVEVIERPPADPFKLPLHTSANLLSYSYSMGSGHRVRLKGVVTYSSPNGFLFFEDEAGGVKASLSQPAIFKTGDEIEVAGFPKIADGAAELDYAVARRTGTRALPAPKFLLPGEAMSPEMENQQVTFQGKLLAIQPSTNGQVHLYIESNNKLYCLSSTVGSEAWNSRDLKSRPH